MKLNDRLTEILCEYTDRVIRGERPEYQEYVERYPDLKDALLSYFQIGDILYRSLKPVRPPAELLDKIIERFQSPRRVSKVLQEIIGRAVCDEVFRKSLFLKPEETCLEEGYKIAAYELAALKNIDAESLEKFAGNLDERLTKTLQLK